MGPQPATMPDEVRSPAWDSCTALGRPCSPATQRSQAVPVQGALRSFGMRLAGHLAPGAQPAEVQQAIARALADVQAAPADSPVRAAPA